ncbi:hypothetical protein H6P81_019220 [Aristolochia fimbriata]|uniref:TCP domain-containing protein n=1 Tax=Aristolochia fimbriata TaxID=158543 RepID=A0AAV7DR52_ARIFI|nr:hypothetical protein H6P81_019220 [Aristolochia fimbriata]
MRYSTLILSPVAIVFVAVFNVATAIPNIVFLASKAVWKGPREVDQTPNSPPPFLPGTSISSFGGFCLRYGSYCAQIYFHMNTRRENAFPSNNKQVEGVVLVSGNNSSNICEYGKKKKSNNNNSNSNIIVPAGCSSRSSRPWSILKDPRIVRVSRSLGGKDRHSKVRTIRGLRDRRVRLSVQTAIQLYDLQDRLGLNQPSKVVDWLLAAAQQDIDNLPPLPLMPLDNFMMHYAAASASAPAHHHHLHHHQLG